MKLFCSLLVISLLSIVSAARIQSDTWQNISQIIEQEGYPVENYWVVTSDGFSLSVVRIPNGRNQQRSAAPKPVAFLQHGLLDTGASWVLNGPEESLGFMLADAGFDVYLGNVRGNTYSSINNQYSNETQEYWNLIDFDNMISIDLPAMLNLALQISGQSSLTYIVHSQGTIMGFGGFPMQPELAAKVDIFIALAPVAFVSHQTSFAVSVLADLDVAEWLFFFGEEEFLPSDWVIRYIAGSLCDDVPILCEDVIFLICGFDPTNINSTRMPLYMSHTPGGTSVRNMFHWSQMVSSGQFQMFDYGAEGNQEHYHQATPPLYSPQNMNSPPVAFFTGSLDDLADPADVQILLNDLPSGNKPVLVHNEPTYEHLDFTWGIDAHTKIYPSVIQLAQKYSK